LTRATRLAVALAGVLFVVLGASGAWLWWDYRPDEEQWIRDVHRVAALALLVVAVGLLVLAILRRRQLRVPGVLAAVGGFVTVGAAYLTGRLLPWDQLALWAVTVGNDVGGIVMHDEVKFVLIDGREVAPSTYEAWAYAHLVLSALVVVALALVWLRAAERPEVTPS
jgi:quinol-cytochrome oxidoreductase complex cytochrome b subunit